MEEPLSRRPRFRVPPCLQDRVKAIEHNLPKAEQQYELAGCRAPKSFFGSGAW